MKSLQITIILASLILPSSCGVMVNAQTENPTPTNPDCKNRILQSEINETRAILFAVDSDRFKLAVNGSDVKFNNVYYKSDTVCEGLQSVNVLFYVKLSDHVTSLVIKEDPTLTKIIGVEQAPALGLCFTPDPNHHLGLPTCCVSNSNSCDFTGIPLQQELDALHKQSSDVNQSLEKQLGLTGNPGRLDTVTTTYDSNPWLSIAEFGSIAGIVTAVISVYVLRIKK
ncbi:MAG TPA: hypothetical protein VFX64_05860 [Candidatus Nitrosotalea sp.]|nr:hypothetical protein [Candidatus Nitrosotalea sp.]